MVVSGCYVLFASLIVECGCLLHQLLVQMLGRFVLAMSEGLCDNCGVLMWAVFAPGYELLTAHNWDLMSLSHRKYRYH